MRILDGSSNDIFTVVGLGLGLFIALRCLFVFIYPLFCFSSIQIATTERIHNETNVVIPLQVKNVPIVKAEYIEEDIYDIPIATIV